MIKVVGVDLGGTWIRLKGFNASGKLVRSLTKPAPALPQLPNLLKRSLKSWGQVDTLAVASRGVWMQAKRRQMKRALHGLARHIVVIPDIEAAWLTTFSPHPPARRLAGTLSLTGRGHKAVCLLPLGEGGRRPDEGILVISGTGSIAYGRNRQGKFARAGGLGPAKGDEGSGYWIGKEWVKGTPSPYPLPKGRGRTAESPRRLGDARRADEGARVRQIASYAKKVIHRAEAGDPKARAVVQNAQRHLAALVVKVADKLHMRSRIPVGCAGSVLMNPYFQRGFWKELGQTVRGKSIIKARARTDAATAAAHYAINRRKIAA